MRMVEADFPKHLVVSLREGSKENSRGALKGGFGRKSATLLSPSVTNSARIFC